jgi:hypothetical protein
MGPLPGVTDAAASLLEVEPSLACAVGARAVAEIGHEPILPVLTVPAGPWEPPDRAALGAGIVAVVVLEGLLAAGTPACVVGPGDVLEPWDRQVKWVACTSVRLALVGTRFMEAVQAWPDVAAHLLARAHNASSAPPAEGPIDERILDLLWQIAARWGTAHGDSVALPRAVDAGAMGGLLQLSERRVEATVALFAARGTLVRRDGPGWLMPAATAAPRSGHSRQRRDQLRARLTQQLALARELRHDHAALNQQVQRQLAIGRDRRRSSA